MTAHKLMDTTMTFKCNKHFKDDQIVDVLSNV